MWGCVGIHLSQAGCCGNEPEDYKNGGEFLDWLEYCNLLKDSTSWVNQL